ncbi:NAD-dependent epimerase/dehydratase family protein [Paenibacillus sp. G2S3]|uniref:NAD-dependent epimerase/dehydratase family protein n=1 Tax=Paenibacillus sp. G2S3 TaxID=3047872 RepID=UPI0024C15082|nr:NAD-dependent epimerase/dehydratase family protein [Paenibacillus sp. G2S3]WHY22267.1 NAD-dependent epimerase/dehydratase family protein [Paenibacillus sp. G2S3]
MRTVQELEERLASPSTALIEELSQLDGDIMLLGVGGKMGPSLARLAVNAIRQAGLDKKVIGVSRFSNKELRRELEEAGVEIISADLSDDKALQVLPETQNILYMAGNKFGTTGNEHFTWMMNAYLPGRVAERFRNSRMVVFSTGNVYPFTPVSQGGATERTSPNANGEYGQSCLGRERIFEHFSHENGTPMFIYRLNYAIDLRYGVLLELARSVREGLPIDITMGHANVIWQGDANEIALRALLRCSSPPNVMNITGPETLSLRWAANEFGRKLGIEPIFTGIEAPTALLSNAAKAAAAFGYPRVSLAEMIDWIGDWVGRGGETWNKPTHFQEREGKY